MKFNNLPTDQKNEITVSAIEIEVTYPDGSPLAGAQYELALSSGGTRKGSLSGEGKLKEDNIPPGTKLTLKLPGIPLLALAD
jgi:hypothetical protein